MARALLLALTCAAAASAARYADYSGVKMPAYGVADYEAPRDVAAPADDYRGHSPDAPASPDYKYEEEPRGDSRYHLCHHSRIYMSCVYSISR